MLRRYLAGQAVIADFVVAEAEREGRHITGQLQCLLRAQATVFDRLVAAVTEEHRREVDQVSRTTPREQQAERIRRLLAGEPVDTSGLDYDFDGHHIGLIATAPEAAEIIRDLAIDLDLRLLTVRRDEDTLWAWLGAPHPIDPAAVDRRVLAGGLASGCLAVGEPGEGLCGWRCSHRQAVTAAPIGVRRGERLVRYRAVALLASILQDELLATFLRETYLKPLEGERDRGEHLLNTLRAYFAADHNISSAAVALGVDRRTVTKRLRLIEASTGAPIRSTSTELAIVLRLSDHSKVWASHPSNNAQVGPSIA